MIPAARPRKNQTAAPIIISAPAMMDGCTAMPKPARSEVDLLGLVFGFADAVGIPTDKADLGICGAGDGERLSSIAELFISSGEGRGFGSGESAVRILNASSSTSFSVLDGTAKTCLHSGQRTLRPAISSLIRMDRPHEHWMGIGMRHPR